MKTGLCFRWKQDCVLDKNRMVFKMKTGWRITKKHNICTCIGLSVLQKKNLMSRLWSRIFSYSFPRSFTRSIISPHSFYFIILSIKLFDMWGRTYNCFGHSVSNLLATCMWHSYMSVLVFLFFWDERGFAMVWSSDQVVLMPILTNEITNSVVLVRKRTIPKYFRKICSTGCHDSTWVTASSRGMHHN
jgi:hypothetical protein